MYYHFGLSLVVPTLPAFSLGEHGSEGCLCSASQWLPTGIKGALWKGLLSPHPSHHPIHCLIPIRNTTLETAKRSWQLHFHNFPSFLFRSAHHNCPYFPTKPSSNINLSRCVSLSLLLVPSCLVVSQESI